MITRFSVNIFRLVNDKLLADIEYNRILDINIRKRYQADIFPRILVSLYLTHQELRAIYNKSTVAMVSILESGYNTESDLNEDGIPLYTKPVVNDTFDMIITSNVNNIMLQSTDTLSESDESDYQGLDMDLIPVEIALIKTDNVNKIKKLYSMLYPNSSKSSILLDIVQHRGYSTEKVIISPPISNDAPSLLHITSGDMLSNIEELNDVYGLYDSLVTLFQDIDYLYILNTFNPNIIFAGAEPETNIILRLVTKDSNYRNHTGSYYDEERKTTVVYIRPDSSIVDNTDISNKIYGSGLVMVGSTPIINSHSYNLGKDSFRKQIFTDNPLSAAIVESMVRYNNKSANVTMEDCPYDTFRPYRYYVLEADDDEMRIPDTKWILSEVEYSFKPANDDMFKLQCNIVLRGK